MIRSVKQPSSFESIPQWQTIYCSLVLLLVVFFIMLIAYSAVDKDRFRKVQSVVMLEKELTAPAPEVNQAMESLRQLTARAGMETEFAIVKTPKGFKAVVPNPVLFGSGDASLNEGLYSVLDGIIKIAKQSNLMIQVEGHTDNLPIETAQFPSNWELSTMRAVNIVKYLQKNGGIPQDRLAAVGFAEYRPAASNATPEGRRTNRRIEIQFQPGI